MGAWARDAADNATLTTDGIAAQAAGRSTSATPCHPRAATWTRPSRWSVRAATPPVPRTSVRSRTGWPRTDALAVDLMNRYSSDSTAHQHLMNYWTQPPAVVVETVAEPNPGAAGPRRSPASRRQGSRGPGRRAGRPWTWRAAAPTRVRPAVPAGVRRPGRSSDRPGRCRPSDTGSRAAEVRAESGPARGSTSPSMDRRRRRGSPPSGAGRCRGRSGRWDRRSHATRRGPAPNGRRAPSRRRRRPQIVPGSPPGRAASILRGTVPRHDPPTDCARAPRATNRSRAPASARRRPAAPRGRRRPGRGRGVEPPDGTGRRAERRGRSRDPAPRGRGGPADELEHRRPPTSWTTPTPSRDDRWFTPPVIGGDDLEVHRV